MNEVQMRELIEAIEKLSQKGWVDYLIIIVPILLSVVAVWISLATAHKQNKIALLEKRHKTLEHFRKIFEFRNLILSLENFCGSDEQKGGVSSGTLSPFGVAKQLEWLDHNFDLQLLKGTADGEGEEREGFGSVASLSIAALRDAFEGDTVVLFFVANKKQRKIMRHMLAAFYFYVLALIGRGELDVNEEQKIFMDACEEYQSARVHNKLLKKIQP